MLHNIAITVEEREQREHFFKTVLGSYSGYICVARLDRKKKFAEDFFFYPDQLNEMHEWIERHIFSNNLYFCPQLLETPSRRKTSVQTTPCLWADLDEADPTSITPIPSVVLESSTGRYQGFWPLKTAIDPFQAENYSRRIAYAYSQFGADISGWDLTQLLRIPLTLNFKYEQPAHVPIVQILELDDEHHFSLADFDHLAQVPGHEYLDVDLPEDLPQEEASDILERHRQDLPDGVWRLYSMQPSDGDWSAALWNLECLLFEGGLTREEAYIVCKEAACNKFKRDGRSDTYLWKDICRAATDIKNRATGFLPSLEADVDRPLLTGEEQELIASLPDTFVERYIEYGKSVGDAAHEYHVAGAFTILSGLLCGIVELPTSYGIVYPNLWFMLLADTTLTRKSTAMDLAVEILMDVDPDIILATDGSIEGLLSALSQRANRPSIFLRDEVSGMIEAMRKKDYLAGMAEMFTKLYDGKYQKRLLRKEEVEVRNPRLIVFSGGPINRTTQALDHSFVTSGFLPRFIVITAEPNLDALKPLGRATKQTTDKRDTILKEAQRLQKTYEATTVTTIMGTAVEVPKIFTADLTDEAWERFGALEKDMIKLGYESDMRELTTPTYDRLAMSILKAAVLIAAADKSISTEGTIEVRKDHLLRALYYGDQWKRHVEDVLSKIGRSQNESMLQNVYRKVQKEPGVLRSKVMNHYHLESRVMDIIEITLIQRGLIQVTKVRGGHQYFPIMIHPSVKGVPSKITSESDGIQINQI